MLVPIGWNAVWNSIWNTFQNTNTEYYTCQAVDCTGKANLRGNDYSQTEGQQFGLLLRK